MAGGILFYIICGLGGIGWTLCYVACIVRGFKDKTSCMPLIALGLNISWEFVYSFIWIPENMMKWPVNPQLITNIIWFLFDVIIIYQKFRYGRDEFNYNLKGLGNKLFFPTLICSVVICFLAVYYSALEWQDWKGQYSGYIMNVLMSVAFISMFAKREGIKGQSIYIAGFKWVGTTFVTIAAIKYQGSVYFPGTHPFIIFCGFAVFFYDTTYLVLLIRRYKELGINLWTRKQINQVNPIKETVNT